MNVSDTGRRLRMTWATQLIMLIFMLVCLFTAYVGLFTVCCIFCLFLLDTGRRLRINLGDSADYAAPPDDAVAVSFG